MRNWNQPYLDFAKDKGWRQRNDPVQLAIYSDTLQAFRLAAQGKSKGRHTAGSPARAHRHLLRPAAVLVRAAGEPPASTPTASLAAITQRPMAMYHSWDSQNAWLRQIHSHNYLHVNPRTAQEAGIADGGWAWVTSAWGGCAACCATAMRWSRHGLDLERDRQGFRRLAAGAWCRRVAQGLPAQSPDHRGAAIAGGHTRTINSDPVTSQAGWYDVRVNLARPAGRGTSGNLPQMAAVPSAWACSATLRAQ